MMLCVGLVGSSAVAQDDDTDDVDPASLRRFWLSPPDQPVAAAAPYKLTAEERTKFKGTFGIDLSHYTFDIWNENAAVRKKCREDAAEYLKEHCSCRINWQALAGHGLRFVYTKASDGKSVDRSFDRAWSELKPHHASGTLYRGAYHFLRPGVDAGVQAETFLRAIGATNGARPPQLPPVLDIEWSNREISPNAPEFDACPATRRTMNDRGKYYCDMWYKLKPDEIAALAKQWIDRVESATGLPVIIYTNPTGWWNSVMTSAQNHLMSRRAVWTSRYTSSGPKYSETWNANGGSSTWKMAPLPRGAAYPQGRYSVPHFWQFTESGRLPSAILNCARRMEERSFDLNWLPVAHTEFPALFGVGRN